MLTILPTHPGDRAGRRPSDFQYEIAFVETVRTFNIALIEAHRLVEEESVPSLRW